MCENTQCRPHRHIARTLLVGRAALSVGRHVDRGLPSVRGLPAVAMSLAVLRPRCQPWRIEMNDSPGDVGDAAVADETISEALSEADLDAATLQQIGDALRRIEDGTYGRCAVDGGPIEATRLEAAPWTAYCITHQKLLEAGSRPKPTL